jgi:serine/threonine protein kinase
MDSPPTADWLPPRDSDESTADWVTRLCEHMHARWLAGKPLRVAAFTQAFPELAADREAVLELIAQERLLRAEAGVTPKPEEYVALYPAWEAEINELFRFEEGLLDLAEVSNLTTPSPPAGPAPPGDEPPPPVPPRFEFRRWLGHGGFGRVGLYRDTKLKRAVAFKFIRTDRAAESPIAAERFRREAAIVARLNHPNVCTLHEFDLDHDPPYLVFEYVDGQTLLKVLESGPLPVAEAVRVVRDVATGLVHCHALGVVHRDVKPGNIKRREDGVVKVLDLGLAKPLAIGGEQLTSSRTTVGTIAYCSPEQLQTPRDVEAASDQFSLGIVLYELLTGHRPFPGDTVGEVVAQITGRPLIPPQDHRPELDDAIVSIVRKMLEKRATDRFASMDEVRKVLDDYLSGNRTIFEPPGWSRRAMLLAGGALLAVVAGGVGVRKVLLSNEKPGIPDPPNPTPPGPQTPTPIEAGPPPGLASLLSRIAADLATVDEPRQADQRYLSLAHLRDDSRGSQGERQRVRDALTTLLPKLSATGSLVRLEQVAGDPALLRFDLRQLGWVSSPGGQWEAVVRRYPFSLRYAAGDLEPGIRAAGSTIRKLLGSDLTPFVLADWFIATASDAPLATELLGLTLGDDQERRSRLTAIQSAGSLARVRNEYSATPVDLARASAELGLEDPQRLRELLLGKDDLTTRLGVAPWLQDGTIPRAEWLRADLDVAPFAELATELKLGVRRLLR